jgi:hypothetical protein
MPLSVSVTPPRLAVVLLLALGAPATGFAADPTTKAAAKQQFEKGVSAYKAGNFRHAVQHFRAADELVPSPRLSFNIARAYERSGDAARALEFYRDYLRRSSEPVNARDVKARVSGLEAELARSGVQQITVHSQPPGARLLIDGADRGRTPWTGELAPGRYRVVVDHEQHGTREVHVQLPATRALDVSVTLAPPHRTPSMTSPEDSGGTQPDAIARVPETRSRMTGQTPPAQGSNDSVRADSRDGGLGAWPWITLAAGGASLAGATALELLRRDAESDARSARLQPAYYEHRERMEDYQTSARVFLGVGGALALGGALLVLVDRNANAEASDAAPSPRAALECGPKACIGRLRGTF